MKVRTTIGGLALLDEHAWPVPSAKRTTTHKGSVLEALDHDPQHLACFVAHLVNQVRSDPEQVGERMRDDLVEVGPVLCGPEPIDATEGKQTLQPGVDRKSVMGVEQSHRDVHKVGPLLGEIMLQDLLHRGDELLPHLGRCRRKDGQEAVLEARLLILSYWGVVRIFFGGEPASRDPILQVNRRCKTCR